MSPAYRSRIFAVALAAFFVAAAPVVHFADNQVKVDTISGLQLSGYGKDDNLKWTIDARKAMLEPGSGVPGTDALKTGKWNVEQLKVETFSFNSKNQESNKDIVVESPNAEFFPEKRFAQSDARVSVKSTDGLFSVNGRAWSWQCDNTKDANRIAVEHDVTVTLFPSEKDLAEKTPITVTSDALEIEIKDDETVLTFSRNAQRPVSVLQGEITTHCDTLSIVIPGNAKQIEAAGRENADESDVKLSKIRKISGNGNVRIHARERNILLLGDAVELTPGNNSFNVRGNVEFKDLTNSLNIRGENATGHMLPVGKKFTLKTITIDNQLPGKNSEGLVSVEMNALDDSEKSSGKRALFQGENLSLALAENGENIVRLERNVSVTDPTLELSCDVLEVRSNARNSDNATGNLRKSAKSDIREIIARGNVVARQDGRVLECGHAHMFPQKDLAILSENPRVSVPADNFLLTGERCEIFKKQKRVYVYGNAAENRRVTASFFPGTQNTGTPATLCGNFLELSQDALNPKLSVLRLTGDVAFESPQNALNGSCERLFVWFDAKNKALQKRGEKQDPIEALQKIEALGKVRLKKEDVLVTGGKALLFTHIEVEEWMSKDKDGSDGEKPMKVVMLADEENIAETRPVITLPQTATTDAFTLPLPNKQSAAKKNSKNAGPIVLSGDELETLFGERRIRCWLRGDVLLKTDEAECRGRELEAELRRPDKNAQFEPEVIFCRHNVRITREDAVASGDLLEISPRKKLGSLSGNATMKSAEFGETTPGKAAGDRFILDLEKQEVRIETLPEALRDNPSQVARPRTLLPKGIFERFSENSSEHLSKPSKK